MIDYDYDLELSEYATTNINILRVFSINIIVFSHGLENIAAIGFDNPPGVSGFTFLMLISGLLIANSILKRNSDGNYDFKKFFLRRFSRIYPVLFVGFIFIILFDQLNGYKFLEHIDIFICNILLLNDSALGYGYYGPNRQLWFLPLFWWIYLVFGWLLLGLKTVKKKFLYVLILGFFSLIIAIICLGAQTTKKINYLIIWLLSAAFIIFLNEIHQYINKKMESNQEINKNKFKLRKRIKYLFFLISVLFFIIALIRGIYFKFENPYELIYNLFLTGSVLFFLAFSQLSKFTYPKIFKKIINFLASYSFSLFVVHFTLFNFLLEPYDSIFYYIVVYISVNIFSIGIAYFTEFKHDKIYYFLLRLFKLKIKSEKMME
jgi:peptidoglycan/LPS O-acetylase OafA/YrhL